MKKLLPIILAAVMLLAALTACSEPNNIDATEIPSQEPSAQVTQNAQQTEAPTEEPVAQLTDEQAQLFAFLNAPSQIPGVVNGQFFNPNIDTNNSLTWENAVKCVYTDSGKKMTELSFGLIGSTDRQDFLLPTSGELSLTGFEELEYLSIDSLSGAKLTIRNCPKLNRLVFSSSVFDEVDVSCYAHELFVTGLCNVIKLELIRFDNNEVDSKITLSAEGTGKVRLLFNDTVYGYTAEAIPQFVGNEYSANPLSALSRFVGWFDENGNLVSTNVSLELDTDDNVITLTARFE